MVLIEGAGAAISSVAEIAMSNAAQEFLTRANQCKNATCAEKLIKEELQRMANLSSRFEDTEIKAIDQEFTRLVGLIPDNAQMYKTMLADNTLPWYNSDSWEPEQVWNAVGIGLQLASVIKTLWGPTTSRLTKTSSTLKNKIKNAKARFNRTAPAGKKVGGDAPNPGASSSQRAGRANRQSASGARNTETGTGANNSSRAASSNPSAASNAQTGLHPDVQNFNKRQFVLKYHPDKIPPSLSAEADEITKMAADFDKLSDAQKLELSNKIRALETKLPRERLAVTMARSKEKLDAMKNSTNTRQRTTAMEEAQTALDELRADARAAREAGFTKEADEADAMIKRMEDEINAAKNPPKQQTQPSKENSAGETPQQRQAEVVHAEPAEAEVIRAEPSEAVVIRAEPAAPVRPSALDSMKERTGLQNLVESNNNSAGVRQFRQLANSEEEADQIVARLQSQNIYAGKIQKGDEWYVAIVENADDYTKMQSYILPSKNIRVRMAGEATVKRVVAQPQKLNIAKQEGRAGFHGSDADIAVGENIRWSKGSRSDFDGVSIAQDRATAENYAINRLVKQQNPHLTNGSFSYDQNRNILTIQSDTPLNLDNKTFYIYELAADDSSWIQVGNGYAGWFNAHYNKGLNGTEWLSKEIVNLEDLIRSGRVVIDAPM